MLCEFYLTKKKITLKKLVAFQLCLLVPSSPVLG